jgi:sirohydrochlorin cobaltochelatase
MSLAPKPHSALLIVGHGSTENPDSSTPYFDHADEVRRRKLFAEVHCCFWKEEPSLREAHYLIDASEVYVVPDFISEGYFTQDVIPRELGLTGPTTEVRGKTFHYCLPVGVHPSMTSLILRRAREVAPNVNPAETTLIITGHGTGLNQNSTKAIRDQVALIAASGAGYAAVLDAYMEEAPFIADWHEMATTPNVVVVPFFIADGLHSYQDIPVLLGMESEPGAAASQREVFRHNPHHLRGKTLFYSSAIGTERLIADVILDQVRDFDTARATPIPATA